MFRGLAPASRLRPFACFMLLASGLSAGGCWKVSVSRSTTEDDERKKAALVTCDLRCEWTDDGPIANLSFTNVSGGDLALLQRNLLAGDEAAELSWSPFEVTRNGARVPFRGAAVNHAAHKEGDYRMLTPGEVVTATVNVGSAYDFSAPGTYSIRYASVNFARDAQKRIDIASNTVELAKPGSR
jgi:hypothetical protein